MKAHGATLAERLKSRRKELGLSQDSLATKCGVSQPTIANWERGGHVPRQAALHSISKCLNIDPVWLLSGTMPSDKHPAQQHLSKPIHNIPVYDWPAHIEDLRNAEPTGYVVMSLASGDILAIIAQTESEYPDGTVLIFDRQISRISGQYLAQIDGDMKLIDLVLAANDDVSDWDESKMVGRLIFSVQPH